MYFYLYTGFNFCFKTTMKHIKLHGHRLLISTFHATVAANNPPKPQKRTKTKYDQSRHCMAVDFNPVTIQIATTTFSVILSILLCFQPAVSEPEQKSICQDDLLSVNNKTCCQRLL